MPYPLPCSGAVFQQFQADSELLMHGFCALVHAPQKRRHACSFSLLLVSQEKHDTGESQKPWNGIAVSAPGITTNPGPRTVRCLPEILGDLLGGQAPPCPLTLLNSPSKRHISAPLSSSTVPASNLLGEKRSLHSGPQKIPQPGPAAPYHPSGCPWPGVGLSRPPASALLPGLS